MERGVVALFGETTMLTSDSLKQFVNAYNIPFFTWSYPNLKTNDFVDFNNRLLNYGLIQMPNRDVC